MTSTSPASLTHRTRWTPSQAQQHLAHLAESGLTVEAFCRQQGYSAMRIFYWRKRLRSVAADQRSPFIEITPSHQPTCVGQSHTDEMSERGIVVHLPNGARIPVDHGFDPRLLRAVVETLI
jgi:hypothetical protein